METKIRLHRTGLVVFSARIVSIFSGMLFLIMVTGWLNPAKFGLWEVIISFVALASYPSYWLGFWGTREVARGRMVGRTTIVLNFALSVGAILVYFAYSALAYSRFSPTFGPFLLALFLIPLVYWNQAVNSVAAGYRPEVTGYAILFAEAGKLLVAYPALFIFRLDIEGVILAVIASYAVQSAVTSVLVRRAVSEPTDLALGKRWLSDSWVPGFNSLGTAIAASDTIAAAAIAGTLLAGYYQAAFQVGILVSYSMFLSYALYPLLLRGESDRVTSATLDLILMFGVPMAVGAIVLAPNLLLLLSPAYVAAGANVSLALGILALVGLATAVSVFFDSALIGKETADLSPDRNLRTYLKSSFSFVALVNAGYSAAYLVSVVLTTSFGTSAGIGVSNVVAVWATCQLGLLVVAILMKLRRLRRVSTLGFPAGLPKYLLVSLVMAASLYLFAGLFLAGDVDRLLNGTRVAGVVAGGAAVYFGVLLVVDAKSRKLASGLLSWLR